MKNIGPLLLINLCIFITGCVSTPSPRFVLQFSPDEKLSSSAMPALGESRMVSMVEPGKSHEEIATLSSTHPVRITLIETVEGTILFERPSYFSWKVALVGNASLGIPPDTEIQLPEGSYRIGARFLAVNQNGIFRDVDYSPSDQYLTVNVEKGSRYILRNRYDDAGKMMDDHWALELVKTDRLEEHQSPRTPLK